MYPNLVTIKQAHARITPYVYRTPLMRSLGLSREFGRDVFMKLENWQRTGSFKIRGAMNKVLSLSARERKQGIITASAGNHGLGVAHAATICGVEATIVLPENASAAKQEALANYDVHLLSKGSDYDAAETYAREVQEKRDLTFVHAFDDPAVICGQGTVGLEILDELPAAATIVVPVGGGGLISGVASAVKLTNPGAKIVGVQSEASPAMFDAVRAGRVLESPISDTVADGLAGRFVCQSTLALTQRYVDDVVLVSEISVRKAMRVLFSAEHFVVEGSAAVTLAAVLEGKVGLQDSLVLILTGRNIPASVISGILLSASG